MMDRINNRFRIALGVVALFGLNITGGAITSLSATETVAFSTAQNDAAANVSPLAAEVYAGQRRLASADRAVSLVTKGANEAWACASCHGVTAEGGLNVPRLAGLSFGYIAKQLHDYLGDLRTNDNMKFIVAQLSDQQILDLAAYYAQMKPTRPAGPSLGGDLVRGAKLALRGSWNVAMPACLSCHGSSGWGVGDVFPPLAGQHAPYIAAQLRAWRGGQRTNSPIGLMAAVSRNLSGSDIAAVSDYLASLVPPQEKQSPTTAVSNRHTTSKTPRSTDAHAQQLVAPAVSNAGADNPGADHGESN